MVKDERTARSVASSSGEDPTLASPDPLPADEEVTFSPGQILSDRFRVVRLIARGGMGQVYEAEDLELRQRVALKTIRPALAGNPQAMERFRREIQLSRRITHPNVCRVFDLFRHVHPETNEPTSFLSMELLNGETLAACLDRRGKMSVPETAAVVEQLVDAMEAAHGAGVVHRDFKPQNVLLVDTEKGTRAVVTDFGLARERSAHPSTLSMTESGSVVGTLAYMAPEQLEGKETSASSDIYALGLVMYEMLTGVKPFSGDSPFAVAAGRLNRRPSSPRVHLPSLSRQWEAAILRCLERDPARRFATSRQLAEALFAGGTTRRPARWTLVIGAALLVAALVGLFAARREVRNGPATGTGSLLVPSARRSVAILGFKNLTGREESSWLSTALSEMLSTELAMSGELRVVPGELVSRTKVNLSLTEDPSYAPDTLARIRDQLDSEYVVIGSYVAIGDSATERIRLDLRVQETERGETFASLSATGSEIELFELVADAGAGLRERMGVEVVVRGDAGPETALSFEGVEAVRHHAIGLEQWRAYDYRGARASFEKSLETDSRHAAAHASLADLLATLGHRDEARLAAERALALSHRFTREDRLLIEARHHSLRNELETATRVRKELHSLFPDDVDHRLKLALALADAGETDEAIALVEGFDSTDNPHLALTESIIAGKANDRPRQLASARRAAARATAIGDRLTLAEARIQEASLPRELLSREEALRALERALEIYRSSGDPLGEANVLRLIGNTMIVADPRRARADLERSAALCRQIGAACVD